MTIGAKIRYIRTLRNMTQAELGKAVHLSGDRIRQYENNVRTPKKDKLEEIAYALVVDVSALSDINITSTVDIMHILFELEDELHLQIEKRGNRYSLTFGNESPGKKKSVISLLHGTMSSKGLYLSKTIPKISLSKKEQPMIYGKKDFH